MKKLNLANVKQLTKSEMKKIMAGTAGTGNCYANCVLSYQQACGCSGGQTWCDSWCRSIGK